MILSKTPYRISFFGGGTDYPVWYEKNGGAVLSTTIDKYCHILCRRFPPYFEGTTRVVWRKIELTSTIEELEHPAVKGVLKFLKKDGGFEIYHFGDLPARSGLGAGSSFVVGLLNNMYAIDGISRSKRELALDAIHVEQDVMADSVGSQDQVAAAYGGFNKILFNGKDDIIVKPIQLGAERLKGFESHLMLFFTGMSRSASEIAAVQIKNTPKKEKELRRMCEMVNEAEQLLVNSRFDDFGRMLHEAWQLKRGLSSVISNNRIDEIYNAGLSAGALGGKLLGAGAGGFILFYAAPEAQQKIRVALNDLLYVPFRFEGGGSKILYSDEDLM